MAEAAAAEGRPGPPGAAVVLAVATDAFRSNAAVAVAAAAVAAATR